MLQRPLFAAAALLLALAACAAGTDSSDGRSRSPTTAESASGGPSPSGVDSTAPLLDDEVVDIGDGRELRVMCGGSGSPAVVFESGDETSATQWGLVLVEVAQHTRACAYDRFGVGRSDVADGCRGLAELRGVLEAMLGVVELDPPYVLAGTSGGGFLITGFAYAHPEDVVGMVLADTPRALRTELAPPELLAEISCGSFENQEKRDYVTIEHEVWNGREVLGDFPLTVISNHYGAAASNEEQLTNVEDQRGWLVLSSSSNQIVVTSGHNVPENEADLVSAEIIAMVEAAR